MKSLWSIILIGIGGFTGIIGSIFACALPPDIIHEFRLEVVPGKELEIHYSLAAWGNLKKEIQKEISKIGGVKVYLEETIPEVSHIEIDRVPITLTYLTGGMVSHTGVDTGIFSITQAPLIEGVYRTNIPSDTLERATIHLRFEKTHFRDITPLIHPFLFSNIQKDGSEGSFVVDSTGEQYFTYSHLGKRYSIRNELKEGEKENNFTLFIVPPEKISSNTTNTSTTPVKQNYTGFFTIFTQVGSTLETFFYERGNIYIRSIGLLLAVLLGMAHGLLPGHSKTLISTFIMSKKKTTSGQILLLIFSSAFSHTFFLFVLATIILLLEKGLSHMVGYILTLSALGYIAFGIYFMRKGRSMLTHIREHIPLMRGPKRRSDICHCDEVSGTKGQNRSIFTSGILAGMNPCVDALALFLLAMSIGDGLYAILMILAFSLGLGLTLGSLAWMVSSGKGWLSRRSSEFSEKFSAYTTLYSGLFIIVLGTYTLVR